MQSLLPCFPASLLPCFPASFLHSQAHLQPHSQLHPLALCSLLLIFGSLVCPRPLVSLRAGAAAPAGPQFQGRPVEPLAISTPQFGQGWTSFKCEQKSQVQTTAGTIQGVGTKMSAARMHVVETIAASKSRVVESIAAKHSTADSLCAAGSEMIAAAKPQGSDVQVLIHLKLRGAALDLTVRSTDQQLSNDVHTFLSTALR